MQELAEHVPKGHIPRSMTVHLRGELTRKVVFHSIYIIMITGRDVDFLTRFI